MQMITSLEIHIWSPNNTSQNFAAFLQVIVSHNSWPMFLSLPLGSDLCGDITHFCRNNVDDKFVKHSFRLMI